MASQELPFVSVVVPAYNAGSTLEKCLTALQNQTCPKICYEIIVVDDGSHDDTLEIARRYGVRVLSQANQGAAVARNFGAREAQGELILFTDSDCEPLEDWISQMVEPFSAPEIVGAKGFYKTRQRQIVARFAQLEYDMKCEKLKRETYIDFVDTYSAAYRREVFLQAGGFDAIYTTASGEDSELSYKLSLQGYKMVPVPNAFVYHAHPDRLSKYLKKKYRNAYWRVVTWRKYPSKIVKDSHTPNSHKLEVVLSPLLTLSLGAAFVWPSTFLGITLILFTLFLLNDREFIFLASKDVHLLILTPLLLYLRGMAGAIGAGVRALEPLLGR
ncbi:MAG: glycosyl transferase family 2 [Anaerolinea sp.]|nr:glycosyl transferase family 2 [Anaerolinea sp.]